MTHQSSIADSGSAPATLDDLKNAVEDFSNKLKAKLDEILPLAASVSSSSSQAHRSMPRGMTSQAIDNDNVITVACSKNKFKFRTWEWGGKDFRLVPQDFIFPSGSVKSLWYLWYFGDDIGGICPYRFLLGHTDDLIEKMQRVNFSRAKFVMLELEEIGKHNGLIDSVDDILAMKADPAACESLFTAVYDELIFNIYPLNKQP
jgi:hypothetical protein